MWQRYKNIYHGVSAIFAAVYYGFPGKKLKVIGITGTDGKTTTTHLIHHILTSAHKKASMVSSVFAEIAGKQYDTGFHVTSPNEWQVQKFLQESFKAGEEYMVLEVTSHALDQHRVDGIDFEIGVLTNITHEHLDYHKTYENYVSTKVKLLKRARCAIVNRDDESFRYIDVSKNQKTITYGIKNKSDVMPETFTFTSPLPGEYNLYNCLAAIAACQQLGIKDAEIKKALKTFKGVKGRFEYLPTDNNFEVIIDFAHTPNGIEKVLSTVKPMVRGKLIHVFGSAGLRDRSKRPIMGEKSALFADVSVLTEEDYRTEHVDQIMDEIAQGCILQGARELTVGDFEKALVSKNKVFFRINDRQTAIDFAIQKLARKNDVLIFTGKAHEKSLCRGTVEYPWSEHEAIRKALKKNMSPDM